MGDLDRFRKLCEIAGQCKFVLVFIVVAFCCMGIAMASIEKPVYEVTAIVENKEPQQAPNGLELPISQAATSQLLILNGNKPSLTNSYVELMRRLNDKITITPIKGTDLIELKSRNYNSKEAFNAINNLLDEFKSMLSEEKKQEILFLNGKIQQVEIQIIKGQKAKNDALTRNGVQQDELLLLELKLNADRAQYLRLLNELSQLEMKQDKIQVVFSSDEQGKILQSNHRILFGFLGAVFGIMVAIVYVILKFKRSYSIRKYI